MQLGVNNKNLFYNVEKGISKREKEVTVFFLKEDHLAAWNQLRKNIRTKLVFDESADLAYLIENIPKLTKYNNYSL